VLSGRGLCDELIARPEESYRLCCVVVYDLGTSRMGASYIYDISSPRVKLHLYKLKIVDMLTKPDYAALQLVSRICMPELWIHTCLS